MLTQMKMMYKPNIKRSMMVLIIFHSCKDLLSWKWLSTCRRMADRSLASFFSSVKMVSSWGLTDGTSERLWRSLEEMVVGAESAQCQRTHNKTNENQESGRSHIKVLTGVFLEYACLNIRFVKNKWLWSTDHSRVYCWLLHRTFSVFRKRNCDTVASLFWREANNDSNIFQHEGAEPMRNCTKVSGVIEIGDEQCGQQAGHHQREAEGEQHVWQEIRTHINIQIFA